jgi:hypothetical protein
MHGFPYTQIGETRTINKIISGVNINPTSEMIQ